MYAETNKHSVQQAHTPDQANDKTAMQKDSGHLSMTKKQ